MLSRFLHETFGFSTCSTTNSDAANIICNYYHMKEDVTEDFRPDPLKFDAADTSQVALACCLRGQSGFRVQRDGIHCSLTDGCWDVDPARLVSSYIKDDIHMQVMSLRFPL